VSGAAAARNRANLLREHLGVAQATGRRPRTPKNGFLLLGDGHVRERLVPPPRRGVRTTSVSLFAQRPADELELLGAARPSSGACRRFMNKNSGAQRAPTPSPPWEDRLLRVLGAADVGADVDGAARRAVLAGFCAAAPQLGREGCPSGRFSFARLGEHLGARIEPHENPGRRR